MNFRLVSLAPLVGVEHLRPYPLQRLRQCFGEKADVECVGQSPSYHVSTVVLTPKAGPAGVLVLWDDYTCEGRIIP